MLFFSFLLNSLVFIIFDAILYYFVIWGTVRKNDQMQPPQTQRRGTTLGVDDDLNAPDVELPETDKLMDVDDTNFEDLQEVEAEEPPDAEDNKKNAFVTSNSLILWFLIFITIAYIGSIFVSNIEFFIDKKFKLKTLSKKLFYRTIIDETTLKNLSHFTVNFMKKLQLHKILLLL